MTMEKMRTLCFSVDEDLLRDIHIRAAQQGASMQEYITELMRRDLHPHAKLTPEQRSELHALAEQTQEIMEQINTILNEGSQEELRQGGMQFG